MGRTRIRLILAAMLLVPALLYWGAGNTPSERASTVAPAVDIRSFVKGASVTQYTPQGQIQERLRATTIEYRRQTQYLTAPSLVRYTSDRSAITVNAQQGTLHDDNARLELTGDVIIRNLAETGQTQQLSAPEMTWFPHDNRAETSTSVVYRTEGHHMTAVGMKADMNTNRVELLSKVKGLHSNE